MTLGANLFTNWVLLILQVDRLIGKDHLFKRSIILIKTWCYYESRLLGAHHGLFSTYALETLVLYIFHFFHTTLDGPLAVSSPGITDDISDFYLILMRLMTDVVNSRFCINFWTTSASLIGITIVLV